MEMHMIATKNQMAKTADSNEKESEDHNEQGDDSEGEIVPKASNDCCIGTDRTVSFIGDNFDRSINPRDMRINHQVQSLHLFHLCAAVNRVGTSHL